MIPIGSRVRVRWGGQLHAGTVALHGVSTAGEVRLLVWLSEGLSAAGVYKWFALEAVNWFGVEVAR